MKLLKKLRKTGKKIGSMTSSRKPLATLDAADLRRFQDQRKVLAAQGRLLAMLQVCYNAFLVEIQAKYKVPEDISVNVQTGEVYKIEEETPNV